MVISGLGEAEAEEDLFGCVAVAEGDGGAHHHQRQAAGVDYEVPLAAVDFLARVATAGGAGDGLGRADGLGVDHGGDRTGPFAHLAADAAGEVVAGSRMGGRMRGGGY